MNAVLSRRAFIRSATLAAIAVSLPTAFTSGAVIAQTKRSTQQGNPVFYRFKVGKFQMLSISDGVLDVPAAAFASNATSNQLAEVLRQGFQTETLSAHCNILLVNTGRNKVLIDTGSGTITSPSAGKLLQNLQTVQIKPSDIDTIIITHAHADHIGGLLDAKGTQVFSNARYFVPRVENEFWTQPQVSLPKMKADEKVKQDMIGVAKKYLGTIQDRVTRFEVEREIIPGFSAIPASGHTPGQVAIRITSGDTSMIHTADVVHTHTVNLWHPEWQPIFDADPEQAAATRQQILSKIASDRTLMFAYHFPFPGIGHIRPRAEGGFAWEPVSWQFNS